MSHPQYEYEYNYNYNYKTITITIKARIATVVSRIVRLTSKAEVGLGTFDSLGVIQRNVAHSEQRSV